MVFRRMATVLITGCSGGIGFLAALEFARRGDSVHATMRNPARGSGLARAAADEGLEVSIAELDVTDDGSVQKAVGSVLEADGRIDVLVNNAGVLHLGSVELLPDAALRSTFETNWFGAIRTIRAVLPAMREQGSGTIVNVSSLAGRLPSPPMNWSHAASKAALSTLSDALAWEVAPLGIKVVCIEPGLFATQIVASAGRPADPGSPYRACEEAMVSFFEAGIGIAADPQIVANAIVAAVEQTGDSPVHVLVGEDSEHFVAAYRSMSEREYKEMVRPVYGF
jgi:NAD(P)-dependent dehydrogenase (short-subunit alcohol dehydrogenase family)